MSEICVHPECGKDEDSHLWHGIQADAGLFGACPVHQGKESCWHPTNRFTPRREEQLGQHATDEAKAENSVGGATTDKHVGADDHEGSKMGSERLTSAVQAVAGAEKASTIEVKIPATVQPSGGVKAKWLAEQSLVEAERDAWQNRAEKMKLGNECLQRERDKMQAERDALRKALVLAAPFVQNAKHNAECGSYAANAAVTKALLENGGGKEG